MRCVGGLEVLADFLGGRGLLLRGGGLWCFGRLLCSGDGGLYWGWIGGGEDYCNVSVGVEVTDMMESVLWGEEGGEWENVDEEDVGKIELILLELEGE